MPVLLRNIEHFTSLEYAFLVLMQQFQTMNILLSLESQRQPLQIKITNKLRSSLCLLNYLEKLPN